MPDIPLIATSATAGVAVAGLVLRELQQRRQSIADRVQLAVDAKVGASLIAFRDLEAQLREAVNTAEDVDGRLRKVLDSGVSRMQTLERLLDRAAEIIPEVEAGRVAIPSVLVLELSQADDPRQAMVLLGQLLEHPDADTIELEAGGDFARQQLQNPALALRLYERSVERDQSNVSARAEMLGLRAGRGDEVSRSAAFEELASLAKANPTHGTVVDRLLDAYVQADKYAEMADFASETLERGGLPSRVAAALWRNLGIAREELRRPKEEIVEAFEHAMRISGEAGDDHALVNAARPFVVHLLRTRDLEKALNLIEENLVLDPTESQLYFLKGRIQRKLGRFEQATKSLHRAIQHGNPTEQAMARRELSNVEANVELDRDKTI